jgi:MFS family permease
VSDVYGRRVAYFCTFVVFLGACVGLGLSKSYAALVVLRCVQSAGSASSIAIGAGVIGDITTRAERGGYMGVFQAGLLAPVAVGPVIGGAISGALGWRAIFWVLAGYAAVFLLVLTVLLPETLRASVGNGGRAPDSLMARHPLSIYQRLTKVKFERQHGSPHPAAASPRLDVLGPLRILATKHACPIILFLAVYYAVWQMSITATSTLFASRYGLSQTQIGLTFIANGVGSILGTLSTGKLLDKDFRRLQRVFEAQRADASQHTFPLEKARLRFVPLLSAVQCASVLLFGWTVAHPTRVHIAAPIVFTFVTGGTAVAMQSVVTTYLVDVFPERSAAAGASLNLARCLFAAGGTGFVMPLVDGVGVGLAFTVCVGFQVVALGGLAVQWRWAARWRVEGGG